MRVFNDFESVPDEFCGGAVSVGKFDGMHLGHVLIVHRLKRHACRLSVPSVVVTFSPHPVAVLRPELNVKPICTLSRKIELIGGFNVDALVVVHTDKEFLRQSAETFFFGTLRERLRACVIVSGTNFTFGRDRVGTAESIRHYGNWSGTDIDIVEPIQIGSALVSSSGIRKLIQEGKIGEVNELMPLPYRLTGTVVSGDARGRLLGFPTANLEQIETIIPKQGVYATIATINDKKYNSTTSIGISPTFDQLTPRVEVFLHEFEGNLYGKILHIDLLAYLRDVKKFDSKESLINQMQQDIKQSNEIAAKYSPP
ncbi:MAG: riboflavin biosynthesis protein RibF [Planctomycetaceae bacterium]|nr:riboflavin biosynthesis protein RibF [Planctomycetaceae bacterium]